MRFERPNNKGDLYLQVRFEEGDVPVSAGEPVLGLRAQLEDVLAGGAHAMIGEDLSSETTPLSRSIRVPSRRAYNHVRRQSAPAWRSRPSSSWAL